MAVGGECNPPPLPDLIEAVNRHAGSIKDLRGRAQVVSTYPPDDSFDMEYEFKWKDNDWLLHVRGTVETDIPNANRNRDFRQEFRGDVILRHQHAMNQAILDRRPNPYSAESLVLAGIGTADYSGRPVQEIIEDALANPGLNQISVHEANGLVEVRIEYSDASGKPPTGVRVLTFSPEEQYSVIAHRYINRGRVTSESMIEVQRDEVSGIYLPKKATFIRMYPDGVTVAVEEEIQFLEMKANTGLSSKDLQLTIPEGTMISHNLLQTAYYASNDLTMEEILAGGGVGLAPGEAPTTAPRERATANLPAQRSGRIPVFLYVLGGVALVGGIALLARKLSA